MAWLRRRVLGPEARFMRPVRRYLRAGLRIAPMLREEMAERGLTAKELALEIEGWAARDLANRKPLDWRTIKHAMEGSCEIDTYLMLGGFFGWPFIEQLHTPVVGADPIQAEEAELERMLNTAAAIHARLERRRTARAHLDEVAPASAVRRLHQGSGPGTQDHQPPQSAA